MGKSKFLWQYITQINLSLKLEKTGKTAITIYQWASFCVFFLKPTIMLNASEDKLATCLKKKRVEEEP